MEAEFRHGQRRGRAAGRLLGRVTLTRRSQQVMRFTTLAVTSRLPQSLWNIPARYLTLTTARIVSCVQPVVADVVGAVARPLVIATS